MDDAQRNRLRQITEAAAQKKKEQEDRAERERLASVAAQGKAKAIVQDELKPALDDFAKEMVGEGHQAEVKMDDSPAGAHIRLTLLLKGQEPTRLSYGKSIRPEISFRVAGKEVHPHIQYSGSSYGLKAIPIDEDLAKTAVDRIIEFYGILLEGR